MCPYSLIAKIFFLSSLMFINWILIYHCVYVSVCMVHVHVYVCSIFILLEAYQNSWICGLTFFIKFEKKTFDVLSSNLFICLPSFSSLSWTPIYVC